MIKRWLKASLYTLLLASWTVAAGAQTVAPASGWSEAERWAWYRIRAGTRADFNERCGRLDPNVEDQLWLSDCRKVRSAFFEALLTREPWRSAIPRRGVLVVGASLPDGLDLDGAEVESDVLVVESRFEGAVGLEDALFDRVVSFNGSTFKQGIFGNRLRVESNLLLRNCVVVKDGLALIGARVAGQLAMDGATIEGGIDGERLEVERDLFLQDGATVRGDLVLLDARVRGQLVMNGSSFESGIDGERLQVDGGLFLRSGATVRGDVVLRGAKVGGQLDAEGSTFEGSIVGERLQVDGGLFLRSGATVKGDVVLRGAKVGGQLEMDGSRFEGGIDGEGMQVETNLFLRNGATVKGDVVLRGAKVGRQLEMDGSRFEGRIDGDGLQVGRDLFLGYVLGAFVVAAIAGLTQAA